MIEKQDLENNLNRVQEWIKVADQKISIFVALQVLIIAALIQKLSEQASSMSIKLSFGDVFIMAIFAACIISSFGKALIALIPRIKNNSDKLSAIYFGDIGKMNVQEYGSMLDSLDDTKYKDALIGQIHACSVIAIKKHQQLRWSIILFVLGVAIGMGEYLFLVFKG